MLENTRTDDPVPTPLAELRDLARISLYAALVGAGAFIHVPVLAMHISLQTMALMLAGFALGPRRAALAMTLYAACGLLGLPVFGRGVAGPAALFGPTAGYFLGFIPGAAVAGISARFGGGRRRRLAARFLFGLLGTLTVLLVGALVLWLRFIPDPERAFAVGVLPFIGSDTVKMALAAVLAEALSSGGAGEGGDG